MTMYRPANHAASTITSATVNQIGQSARPTIRLRNDNRSFAGWGPRI